MFHRREHIVCSDIFGEGRVRHGFATRSGGVSTIPEVSSMNVAVRMGDSLENVEENMKRLAAYVGLEGCPVIYSKQIHSTSVIRVTHDDVIPYPETRECDGYVTDTPGLLLLVRSADCVPILFSGEKEDSSPIIGAVHAGWRGTVSGIAGAAVRMMCDLGARAESIRVAVGPSIHDCCFEVKEDFVESVRQMAGKDFADRHIVKDGGGYFASLQRMNTEILESHGILRENIDISPDCTAHMSDIYHSHRATSGMRGTGGGVIGIAKA